MKRCPTCHHIYEDESLLFCLDDGTSLVRINPASDDPAKTLLAYTPRTHKAAQTEILFDGAPFKPQPTPQKNFLPWIIAGISMLLVFVMGIVIAVISSRKPTESNYNQNSVTSAPPRTSQSPEKVIDLAGTFWVGTDSTKTQNKIEFIANGTINHNADDKWWQKGNTVTLEFTNGYSHYDGVIENDHIEYKAYNKVGFKWTGFLNKTKSPAP